jgi:hypothetical protein
MPVLDIYCSAATELPIGRQTAATASNPDSKQHKNLCTFFAFFHQL